MFTITTGLLFDSAAQAMAGAFPRPTPERVSDAMGRIFALADQSWEASRSSPAFRFGGPAPVCKAGCGWCCHQQVGISVPEAIAIACHLQTLPTERRGELTDRLAEANRRARGRTTTERAQARLPCPFLEDGACSIYEVRPLRCRGLISIDLNFCLAGFQDPLGAKSRVEAGLLKPAFLSMPQHIYDHALNGVLKTLYFAKVADYALELISAIHDLMERPKLMESWLRKPQAPRPAALIPDPDADPSKQFS